MGRLIGTLLILLGIILIAIGLYGALGEIRDLYAQATTDAMAQPDIAEEERPDRILRHVLVGAIGVPPLIAGSVLTTRARVRRLRARLSP